MAHTADLRSLSCLLGFFAREVMRVFILLKSSRKCYCSLKFIEVWICMCDHLSHKKIKVRNFCWYIQGLISSACWWFTSFLWMNFSELLLCSSLCQFNLTGQVWAERKCKDSADKCWVKEGLRWCFKLCLSSPAPLHCREWIQGDLKDCPWISSFLPACATPHLC